jgi:hypothetical protein
VKRTRETAREREHRHDREIASATYKAERARRQGLQVLHP